MAAQCLYSYSPLRAVNTFFRATDATGESMSNHLTSHHSTYTSLHNLITEAKDQG